MNQEIRNCLEKVFVEMLYLSEHYERNILICLLHVEKGWSFEEIAGHYKISTNRVRQVFIDVCCNIFYKLYYLKKDYHIPFHKNNRGKQVNYKAFKTKESLYFFEELRKMAECQSVKDEEIERLGWK